MLKTAIKETKNEAGTAQEQSSYAKSDAEEGVCNEKPENRRMRESGLPVRRHIKWLRLELAL